MNLIEPKPVSTSNSVLNILKQLVRKREYDTLETLFLENITQNDSEKRLPEFWECIEYLIRPTIGLTTQAQEFAQLLAEYLIEHNYNNEALAHIRKTSTLLAADRKFKQQIIKLYKILYPGNNLDMFIRLSGLEESTPLNKSISTLDKFLSLDIGNAVFSSRFGYGEITKIDFLCSIEISFRE